MSAASCVSAGKRERQWRGQNKGEMRRPDKTLKFVASCKDAGKREVKWRGHKRKNRTREK